MGIRNQGLRIRNQERVKGIVYSLWSGILEVQFLTNLGNQIQYNFDWDPIKERKNIHKHRLSFRQASTVFRDPNHISIYDENHSVHEDRWITIGIDQSAVLRVLVHTFKRLEENTIEIRIISARKASRKEEKQYIKSDLL